MNTNRPSVVHSLLILIVLLCTLSLSPLHAAPCVDPLSDTDGDGWGYENGESCTVEDYIATTTGTLECIDFDGDGWGWNGIDSCAVSQATPVQPLSATTATECVDNDGDGWGWNGIGSCIVAPATILAPATPVVQPQTAQPTVVITPVVTTTPATSTITTACATTLSPGANLYNAIASNTGRICLRPGNYSLPNNLSFRSNQSLTALDSANPPVITTSANRSLTTTGRSNVSIENIIIDGNRTGATEFAVLVGTGSNNITLTNVTIRNTFGIGIGITGSSNVTIRGGTITNIGQDSRLRQAIWTTTGSRNITIDGLTVRGRSDDVAGGDHAITCIDSVSGFTVRNTRSEYAGSGAVAINNCSNIVVTNNELHNGREHGVDIVNGSVGAIVTGNNITGFDRSAMVFDDHSWQCSGCGSNPTEITVSNNRMSGNNLVNLARCKGIAVDSQMTINPTQQQLQNDWVRISDDNQVDSDSALFCQHIH